ncbi:MAG: NUDIX domain-containing protein [Desulfobacterales bacterium]|nr:NUDIX domain-containing protein [Desulfobacterales bacterium]
MREKIYCCFCSGQLVTKEWEGRIRLFCENCNEAIYENPIPATCSVVINANEEVLLVKRSVPPQKGLWCLPGGFMELGESPEKCALRELKEETGILGLIYKCLGVTAIKSKMYDTILMMGYLIKDYSGEIFPGDDAEDAKFFKLEKLPPIAFDSHKAFIRAYYLK